MHRQSILLLTNAYPDSDSSYRGIFIKKLALSLKTEGYQITIVTPKIFKESHYFEESNGMRVYRFPFLAGDKLLIEYQKIPYGRMLLYFISGFFLTVYSMFKNRCDLIHAHWGIPTGLIGAWVGVLLKKPLVVTLHGSDLRMALEKRGLIGKLFLFVCKSAGRLHCVSGIQRRALEQAGIPGDKISTFPMGVDEIFLETGKKRKINTDKKRFTILSNRNLLPIYNISLLIRSIPMVLAKEPETKFIIAGEGTDQKILEKEVQELNINASVTFIGRIPHEKMSDLLSKADIYVSTSLFDGSSVSLLEAMGTGAFPVVTDIPANREWVINGENGFLVSQKDESLLSKRILEAIQDHRLLESAYEKNIKMIEQRACWKSSVGKTRELYD